jgi:Ca2+-binding EF-hand superfamily protein
MEKQTEKIKCQLAWAHDFSLFQAFKLFDQDEKGYVEPSEFLHGLVHMTGKEVNRVLKDQASLVFSRYDRDGDQRLNYTEFCQLFVPGSNPHLQDQLIARRPKEYGAAMDLSDETQAIFARLLKGHLDLEQSHEYLRAKLNQRMQEQAWTMEDLFAATDKDQKGYVSVLDLQKILGQRSKSNNPKSYAVKDLEYLLRMYDGQGSRRVSFEAFADQLTVRAARVCPLC